jgi:Mn2+/Fe2+ NRAMP family transporter
LCYRIVVLGAILPNLFPGWVTSSATGITYTLGINTDLYRPIAIGLLVTVGLVVTVLPVIYNVIERVEMVLVSVILIFLVFAIFIATKGSSPRSPARRRPRQVWGTHSRPMRRTCAAGEAGGRSPTWSRGYSSTA